MIKPEDVEEEYMRRRLSFPLLRIMDNLGHGVEDSIKKGELVVHLFPIFNQVGHVIEENLFELHEFLEHASKRIAELEIDFSYTQKKNTAMTKEITDVANEMRDANRALLMRIRALDARLNAFERRFEPQGG